MEILHFEDLWEYECHLAANEFVLVRRVLAPAEPPAPKPEVPAVEKLLQQLVRETQSRPPAVVSPPVPTDLEQMLRSFLL